MKKINNKILTVLIFAFFIGFNSFGQKLTLTDLANLCNKKNWEDVNQTLLAKKWTYFDSEKGSTDKYNTITWSYNKDNYSDKAQGWFYLFTFDGLPNKISYSVFNKESYTLIQNSISTAGFKLVNSEIEDNRVTSTYGNSSYTLIISTEKRKDSDWTESSTTAYGITLVKKAGIYDENNGKKTDYYYGDVVEMEYTLANGELNGQVKIYYENGKLKKVGNYLNGVEQGNFVEYDESGNKNAEYVMSKGKKSGLLKVYEDGKLSFSSTFQNDVKNGQHIEYYYSDDSGLMNLKLVGEYLNDEKNGAWKLFYIKDSKEHLLTVENYTKGIKNGVFQEIKGDSIIVGAYRNDKIQGKYKIFRDFNKFLFGGLIKTDTSKVTLITDGNYYDDLKSGYWKNYDITRTLRSEGQYLNDKETGEWKYYYTNLSDNKQVSLSYSKQLFLILNYSNGKLNGKSTRYSFLDEEEYPCSEIDENKNPLDTCIRDVYRKVLETSFYKDNKLLGPYELRDSTNAINAKGNFKNDLRDGEWLHRYSFEDVNNETYYIYQKGNYQNDIREGQWIQYYKEDNIAESFNYKNGELHGEYIDWNFFNKPRNIKQFNNGKLKELITLDSLGVNKVNKFEIYDEQNSSYKTRKTEFLDNGYVTQEYWLNKEKEIDHNWFELNFVIATNTKNPDWTKGYKDGLFGVYDSQNRPLITGKYYKEARIDLWTFYSYDQNTKIESNYNNDTKIDEKYLKLSGEPFSGEFTFIDKENGINEIRKIKDGLRNGNTIFKDLNTGKTIRKENYKNGELNS